MAPSPTDGPDPSSSGVRPPGQHLPGPDPDRQGAAPADSAATTVPAGASTRSVDRSSLGIVLAILSVLAVIAAGLIVAIAAGPDTSGAAGFDGSGIPSLAAPADDATRPGSPTDQSTPQPPQDPSALPTDGGPSEDEYVAVAQRLIRAARAGDCAKARALTDDIFDTAVSDANLCHGVTRSALRDDDLGDYAITFFGTYGAAVEFDEGHTYVSLVATSSGPMVEVLIAY